MKFAGSTTFSEQIAIRQSLKAYEASVHRRAVFVVPRSCSMLFFNLNLRLLITVAARSKAWGCGCSLPGTGGSNPFGDMSVCLLWVLCVVRYWSLRRAYHSSRGVLTNVVCLSVIVKLRQYGDPGPIQAVVPGA